MTARLRQSDEELRGRSLGRAAVVSLVGVVGCLLIVKTLLVHRGRGDAELPGLRSRVAGVNQSPFQAVDARTSSPGWGYAWVDRDAGVLQVPIDDGIQALIVRERLFMTSDSGARGASASASTQQKSDKGSDGG